MWRLSKSTVGKIEQALSSHYRILYMTAWEEDRVEQILKAVSRRIYEDQQPLVVWTATQGFLQLRIFARNKMARARRIRH